MIIACTYHKGISLVEFSKLSVAFFKALTVGG